MSDVVPEHVLRMFPVIQVHQRSQLLEHGVQCRLCLQSFHVGQQVKTLPCRHKVTFQKGKKIYEYREVRIAVCNGALVNHLRTSK